jgi:hypothetical protein
MRKAVNCIVPPATVAFHGKMVWPTRRRASWATTAHASAARARNRNQLFAKCELVKLRGEQKADPVTDDLMEEARKRVPAIMTAILSDKATPTQT